MLPLVAPSECVTHGGEGAALLDLREPAVFAEGHPPGAINIRYDDRHLAERVKRVVHAAPRLLLLAAEPSQVESAAHQLAEAGHELIGVVSGSPIDWTAAGAPWIALPSLQSSELDGDVARRDYHVLDVREPMEWAVGHVPGAQLIALDEVRERLGELPSDRSIAVICESGIRSSSAASLLQAAGFERVFNVADGTAGWRAAGRPLEITDVEEERATDQEGDQ